MPRRTGRKTSWCRAARRPHTFEESGVYEAYCSYHGSASLSGMSMKIAVGDATIEDPLGESSDGDGGIY
ncbi:MAG: hypothetical protein ABEJ84_05940 [Halodesulfurarchaeum sp.]